MRKFPLVVAGALAVLPAPGIAAAQTTTTQFEPQPCVLTLSPSYTADLVGQVAAEVPATAFACPGFTFTIGTDSVTQGSLTNASSQTGPGVSLLDLTYFDAAANAMVSRTVLQLGGRIAATSPITYDRFVTTSSVPYVTHDDKYYRVVLGAPTTISSSVAAPPSCTIALKSRYTWRWNQANYWVIPDSAVQCTGVTFSSATMAVFIPLQSRQQNQGFLSTATRRTYDPATGGVTSRRELRLVNKQMSTYDQLLQWQMGFIYGPASREHGFAAPSGGGLSGAAASIWGRFTVQNESELLPPLISQEAYFAPANTVNTGNSFVRFTSKGPITIKRLTNVTLKAKRVGDGNLRLSITADRNASFRNTTAETYRRQTVLPATPADHAVLRRGNRVLQRVKLSNYGTASVTVKDIPGRNRYSVTMVETDDNYQGRAQVRR